MDMHVYMPGCARDSAVTSALVGTSRVEGLLEGEDVLAAPLQFQAQIEGKPAVFGGATVRPKSRRHPMSW